MKTFRSILLLVLPLGVCAALDPLFKRHADLDSQASAHVGSHSGAQRRDALPAAPSGQLGTASPRTRKLRRRMVEETLEKPSERYENRRKAMGVDTGPQWDKDLFDFVWHTEGMRPREQGAPKVNPRIEQLRAEQRRLNPASDLALRTARRTGLSLHEIHDRLRVALGIWHEPRPPTEGHDDAKIRELHRLYGENPWMPELLSMYHEQGKRGIKQPKGRENEGEHRTVQHDEWLFNRKPQPPSQKLRKRAVGAEQVLPWKTALPAIVRSAERAAANPARHQQVLAESPAIRSIIETSQRHGVPLKQMQNALAQKYKIWDRADFPENGRDSVALTKLSELANQHPWMPELDRTLREHMTEKNTRLGLATFMGRGKKTNQANVGMVINGHQANEAGRIHHEPTLSPEEEVRRHLEKEKSAGFGSGDHHANGGVQMHHGTTLSPEEEVRQYVEREKEEERKKARERKITSMEHHKDIGNHIRRVQEMAEQQKKGTGPGAVRAQSPTSSETGNDNGRAANHGLRIERNYGEKGVQRTGESRGHEGQTSVEASQKVEGQPKPNEGQKIEEIKTADQRRIERDHRTPREDAGQHMTELQQQNEIQQVHGVQQTHRGQQVHQTQATDWDQRASSHQHIDQGQQMNHGHQMNQGQMMNWGQQGNNGRIVNGGQQMNYVPNTYQAHPRHEVQHQNGGQQGDWAQGGWGKEDKTGPKTSGAPLNSNGHHSVVHSPPPHTSGNPSKPSASGDIAHSLNSDNTPQSHGSKNPFNPFTGSGGGVTHQISDENPSQLQINGNPSHAFTHVNHQETHVGSNPHNPFIGPNAIAPSVAQ